MYPSQLPNFAAIVADVAEINATISKKHAEVCDKVSMLITTVQCVPPASKPIEQFVLPSAYKTIEEKPQVQQPLSSYEVARIVSGKIKMCKSKHWEDFVSPQKCVKILDRANFEPYKEFEAVKLQTFCNWLVGKIDNN